MSTVYVLGAGASHGYQASPAGVRPPLATGLFRALFDLDISGDLGVKIGWIINYVRDRYGVLPAMFPSFDMDAEEFMTELEREVEDFALRMRQGPPYGEGLAWARASETIATFDQTLFVFTHILNEIANGPLSEDYVTLAARVRPDDVLITFNWDVLLDRALYEVTAWEPDAGYGFRPHAVFDEGWRGSAESIPSGPRLLKLHGSTNWLSRYISRNMQTGEPFMLVADDTTTAITFGIETGQDLYNPKFEAHIRARAGSASRPFGPEDIKPLCFVSGRRPFEAYNGRFRPGYAPFTYFYSPLDPDDRMPTSPLIIAPVRHKAYDIYSHVLQPLWTLAKEALLQAHRIVVIGFSFPPTDVRARDLFQPASHRRLIELVDPYPDRPLSTLQELGDGSDDVRHVASSFSEYLRSS